MTGPSSSVSWAARRAHSCASPSAAPSAHRRSRSRRRTTVRRAVPDHLLPDLPAPRRRRLAARGGGRHRALERRGRRATRPRREPGRGDRGAADRSSRARRRTRRPRSAAPPSSSGSAARHAPEKLKCLHAHVAFALAQAGLRAGRADPRPSSSRSGPTQCCTHRLRGVRDCHAELSRRCAPAVGGGQPAPRVLTPPNRTSTSGCSEQLEVATEELRKRVGESVHASNSSLDAYGASDQWLRRGRRRPGRKRSGLAARSLSVVQDAAFHNYARGAHGLQAVTLTPPPVESRALGVGAASKLVRWALRVARSRSRLRARSCGRSGARGPAAVGRARDEHDHDSTLDADPALNRKTHSFNCEECEALLRFGVMAESGGRARRQSPGNGATDWLTLGQAARYLGVAQSTIRKWSDQGRLPAFYTPGRPSPYRQR